MGEGRSRREDGRIAKRGRRRTKESDMMVLRPAAIFAVDKGSLADSERAY